MKGMADMASTFDKRLSMLEAYSRKSILPAKEQMLVVYENEALEQKIQERLTQLREKFPGVTADDMIICRVIYDGEYNGKYADET